MKLIVVMAVIRYDGIAGVRKFDRLNAAVQAARLKVPIAESYPSAVATEAHERLPEDHMVRKLILSVRDTQSSSVATDQTGRRALLTCVNAHIVAHALSSTSLQTKQRIDWTRNQVAGACHG